MRTSTTESSIKGNNYTILGPICVVLSALLLFINESPFYLELTAAALIGLFAAWNFKWQGLGLASFLLIGVFAFQVYTEEHTTSFWDYGLLASFELAFLLTTLASLELLESVKAFGAHALKEITQVETDMSQALDEKFKLEKSISELQEKVQKAFDMIKTKTESAEMFERLLNMARSELLEQTERQEKIEEQYFEERKKSELYAQKIEEFEWKHSSLENKLKLAQADHEHLQSNKEALQKQLHDADAKIASLSDQLEKLLDRLKGLENDKQKLETSLDELMKPLEESKDLKRVEGLYKQLRQQFDEKKLALDQTRKELFDTQERLVALENTQQEKQLEIVVDFEAHICELEEALKQRDEELILCEELLTKLQTISIPVNVFDKF